MRNCNGPRESFNPMARPQRNRIFDYVDKSKPMSDVNEKKVE